MTDPKGQRIWEGTPGLVLVLLSFVVALLASTWFLTDRKGVPWTPEGVFLDALIRTRLWGVVLTFVVFSVTWIAGLLLIAVVGMIEIVVLPPRTDTPDHEQQDREQRKVALRTFLGLAGYVVVVALITLVIAVLIAIPLIIMGDLDL